MDLLDTILPEFAELEDVSIADIAQQTGEAEHQEITSTGKAIRIITSSYNSFRALELIRDHVERRVVEPKDWLFLVAGIKRLEHQGDYHCMETAYLFSIALSQDIATKDPFVSPYSREVFLKVREEFKERDIYLAVTKRKAPFPILVDIPAQFFARQAKSKWVTINGYCEFMQEHYGVNCQEAKSLWGEVWNNYDSPKFDLVWERMAELALTSTKSQLIRDATNGYRKLAIYSGEFFKPALEVLIDISL